MALKIPATKIYATFLSSIEISEEVIALPM
jgi:hypothetical protein